MHEGQRQGNSTACVIRGSVTSLRTQGHSILSRRFRVCIWLCPWSQMAAASGHVTSRCDKIQREESPSLPGEGWVSLGERKGFPEGSWHIYPHFTLQNYIPCCAYGDHHHHLGPIRTRPLELGPEPASPEVEDHMEWGEPEQKRLCQEKDAEKTPDCVCRASVK